MGLLDTIRNVLGIQPPLVMRDPDAPFAVSEAARARLLALGPGMGVHLETVPVHRGRAVRAIEGDSFGPPPPALADLPLTLSDADLQRLAGRVLDWRDERWAVDAHLEVRYHETPNPDGRLYLTNQILARGRPLFFLPGDELPDLPARLLEVPKVRQVLLRANTLTIEREHGADWGPVDRGVDVALREHLSLCGRPLEGGADSVSRDPIEEEILQVLEERVLPGIHRDGGTMELVGYREGVVLVSMHGACRTCPSSTATLRLGVERALRDAFPGRVERVEAV